MSGIAVSTPGPADARRSCEDDIIIGDIDTEMTQHRAAAEYADQITETQLVSISS